MILSTTPRIELLNCDCMEYMAGLPDKAFDLAIVDPPYGIGENGERSNRIKPGGKYLSADPNKKRYKIKEWDKYSPNCEYFNELKRVSKNQIIWGANHFIEKIPEANSPSWVVWYKAGQTGGTDFADCELAWTSFNKAVRYFRYDWTGFGHINSGEKRFHPTQKPVALYRWLLTHYAKPGDRILDTHLGSGSSAISAHKMGFDFTGCELDKDYYDGAVKRFKEQTMQQDMFTIPIDKPTQTTLL